METYLLALILGLLALIIRHIIKGSLEGFATKGQASSSGSGDIAVMTHHNTAGVKHTDELIKTAKEKIKSLISNVSKSIDTMSKQVEANISNIAKNTENDMKMAAAVKEDKDKKKK